MLCLYSALHERSSSRSLTTISKREPVMSTQIRSIAIALFANAVLFSSVGCDDGEETPANEIDVVYGETTVTVSLDDLDVVTYQDADHVLLSDVVEAASLGVALSSLEFDFEAADGFRASSSDNCTDFVPVAGELLAQGYINLETMRLAWEEALDFPGCLRVSDITRLLASDVEAATNTVDVVYGETTVTVSLDDLDVVTFQEEDHVLLSDVVEAASLGVELAILEFDFEAADGFRASSSDNCTDFVPVAGELLDQGYINLETMRLAWEEELAFPGCLRVSDISRILASDVE
jgi:hypothetical protein